MEGTLAEVRMFAGNFAPRGWMLCQGQLLAIAQWTAVFSLLGTMYGGNGQTTFGLPDFRGRVALGTGQGPGLPNVDIGEMAGVPNTTLIITNLPAHNHSVVGNVTPQAATDGAIGTDPNGRVLGPVGDYAAPADLVKMNPIPVNLPSSIAGSNSPINNRSPYLGIEFIICVEGIYPSRN